MLQASLEEEDYHCRDFQGGNGGTEKTTDLSQVAQLLSNRKARIMDEDSPAPTSTFNTLFRAPWHMKLLQVVAFGEDWQKGTCLYGFLPTLPPHL